MKMQMFPENALKGGELESSNKTPLIHFCSLLASMTDNPCGTCWCPPAKARAHLEIAFKLSLLASANLTSFGEVRVTVLRPVRT